MKTVLLLCMVSVLYAGDCLQECGMKVDARGRVAWICMCPPKESRFMWTIPGNGYYNSKPRSFDDLLTRERCLNESGSFDSDDVRHHTFYRDERPLPTSNDRPTISKRRESALMACVLGFVGSDEKSAQHQINFFTTSGGNDSDSDTEDQKKSCNDPYEPETNQEEEVYAWIRLLFGDDGCEHTDNSRQ